MVGHHGSFFQILIELFFRTISFGSLPKCIQPSGRPVRFYQPEYMTHVLTGGCGDIPFKGLEYFTKFPRQRECFFFVPFRDIHNLGYFLGSIPNFPQRNKLLLHWVPGLWQLFQLLHDSHHLLITTLLDLFELFNLICVSVHKNLYIQYQAFLNL